MGNIMYLAATAQSTIEYSTKAFDNGVVDSPPYGGKELDSTCLPSVENPNHDFFSESRIKWRWSFQRKVYNDSELVDERLSTEVCDMRIRSNINCLCGCQHPTWCEYLHLLHLSMEILGAGQEIWRSYDGINGAFWTNCCTCWWSFACALLYYGPAIARGWLLDSITLLTKSHLSSSSWCMGAKDIEATSTDENLLLIVYRLESWPRSVEGISSISESFALVIWKESL